MFEDGVEDAEVAKKIKNVKEKDVANVNLSYRCHTFSSSLIHKGEV